MSFWQGIKPKFWDHPTVASGTEKDLFNLRRIWLRSVVLTAAVALIPLCLLAAIDYQVTQKAIESENILRTSRLVSNTRRTITFMLIERRHALQFLVRDNRLEALQSPERLEAILKSLQESFGDFTDLGVIDAQGRQITYSGPFDLTNLDYSRQKWFAEVVERGSHTSDVFMGYRQIPHIVVAVTHQQPDGSFFVLRATLEVERFHRELLPGEAGIGGDLFMVNTAGVLQTPSRNFGGILDPLSLPVPEFSDTTQVFETQGPASERLLIGYAYIDQTPFVLMAVKTKDDLMRPWYKARRQLITYSRLAATTLIIEALKCPPGSAVLYVSPTMGQSRQIVWDLLLDLGREVIQSSHVNNLDITMVNGARIYVRGADRPDTLRGVSLTYAVLDEVADIKPEAWEQVIRASLSDRKGRGMFIGTPKGRNWFYDLWKLGQDDQDSDWKSWHFTTEDNPLIDPTEIESAKKTLSTFAFKQEYLASFSNAGSDVFKEEWIKYGEEPQYGSYFVAVDLAGFEEVAKQAANSKKRLDESAIAVVKVTDDGKWFVKEIDHGRWDIRETAAKILMKMRDYRPLSIGIERGALKNAVLPYLSDLMRKNNVYSHIVDLTHGNRKKTDRVIWSLQGRFEHGRIVLNSEEDWDTFVDQLLLFPSQGVHDDLPDALSYIDQLAVTSYFEDADDEDWQPMDVISGV